MNKLTLSLEREIKPREERLRQIRLDMDKLDLERIALEASVAAYKDALDQYVTVQKPRRPRTRSTTGGISDAWAVLIRDASKQCRDEFDVDSVVASGREIGRDLNRSSVRTQLAAFVTRGLLERPKPGKFMVTASTMKALGEASNEEGSDLSGETSSPIGVSVTNQDEARLWPSRRENG